MIRARTGRSPTTSVVVCAVLSVAFVAPAPMTAAAEPGDRAAGAFDFNGDGYADLAVAETSRAITVVYGSKRGLSAGLTQRLTPGSLGVTGGLEGRFGLGQSIISADFDADSYADLATTAGNRVVVVYGGSSGLTSSTSIIGNRKLEIDASEGDDPNSMAVGDLDGDGFPDLVLSAPGGEDSSGAVAVFPGSPSGVEDDATVISRDTAGVPGKAFPEDMFGSAVAVGDLTADGIDDLIVTSPGAVQGQFEDLEPSGSLYLFPGSKVGIEPRRNSVLSAESVLEGREWFTVSSETRLTLGEFTGDGAADLAVGGSERCGREYPEVGCELVLVLRGGSTTLSPANHVRWGRAELGPAAGTGVGAFGSDLAAGDLDRDGHDDLVVAAPYQAAGRRENAGAVYVIYGTPAGLSPARFQLWTQASPGIKSRARTDDQFGGGFLRILDFGRGRDRDLAVHSPDDSYVQDRNGKPAQGTVNVLYTRGNRVSDRDQLWYPDSDGLSTAGRKSPGFWGGCC